MSKASIRISAVRNLPTPPAGTEGAVDPYLLIRFVGGDGAVQHEQRTVVGRPNGALEGEYTFQDAVATCPIVDAKATLNAELTVWNNDARTFGENALGQATVQFTPATGTEDSGAPTGDWTTAAWLPCQAGAALDAAPSAVELLVQHRIAADSVAAAPVASKAEEADSVPPSLDNSTKTAPEEQSKPAAAAEAQPEPKPADSNNGEAPPQQEAEKTQQQPANAAAAAPAADAKAPPKKATKEPAVMQVKKEKEDDKPRRVPAPPPKTARATTSAMSGAVSQNTAASRSYERRDDATEADVPAPVDRAGRTREEFHVPPSGADEPHCRRGPGAEQVPHGAVVGDAHGAHGGTEPSLQAAEGGAWTPDARHTTDVGHEISDDGIPARRGRAG
jgi:hypothetical protein